jgi:lysozyme
MRRPVILALTAALLAALAPSGQAMAASRLPGIDISSYQGDIDWKKVDASDVRFIIMRVSHALDLDTRFAEYSAAATAHGIPWGAYQYVEPSGKKGDAAEQADLFLQTAKLGSGNLLPVIDIERTNGLGAAALQDFVAQWLNRVRNELGVRPVIYTSPSFWRAALADTKRFSSRGYRLWIAHWKTRRPDVPAGNWSKHGWTFWQWTNCGSVSGIKGCVDKDRLNGSKIPSGLRIP